MEAISNLEQICLSKIISEAKDNWQNSGESLKYKQYARDQRKLTEIGKG